MVKKKKDEKICPSIVQMNMLHEVNLYLPTRTVYFGGDNINEDIVNSTTVAQTIKNLLILENQHQGKQITLILNSCGGSWFDGVGLYDIIKSLKSPVTIIGVGKVFSMGSIILQAGKNRIITKHTTTLIHDGNDGFEGTPKSCEAWAENSKVVRMQSYEIYYEQMVKKNKKITIEKIEAMCSHDTILTAEECVKIGLADEIMQEMKK